MVTVVAVVATLTLHWEVDDCFRGSQTAVCVARRWLITSAVSWTVWRSEAEHVRWERHVFVHAHSKTHAHAHAHTALWHTE